MNEHGTIRRTHGNVIEECWILIGSFNFEWLTNNRANGSGFWNASDWLTFLFERKGVRGKRSLVTKMELVDVKGNVELSRQCFIWAVCYNSCEDEAMCGDGGSNIRIVGDASCEISKQLNESCIIDCDIWIGGENRKVKSCSLWISSNNGRR